MEYTNYLNSALSNLKEVLDKDYSPPIFFVGSGFSRRYINSPDWKGLVKKIVKDIKGSEKEFDYYCNNAAGDLAKVASLLINDYWDIAPCWSVNDKSNYIKEIISTYLCCLQQNLNIELSDELKLLRKANPYIIITTNYDGILELVYPKRNSIKGLGLISDENAPHNIWKIHGCVYKPESIIVTTEDYNYFSKNQKYLREKLYIYFTERPVIFIGYSIRDENILNILADIYNYNPESFNQMWFVQYDKDADLKSNIPLSYIVKLENGKEATINYVLVKDYLRLFKTLSSALQITGLNKVISRIVWRSEKRGAGVSMSEEALKELIDRSTVVKKYFRVTGGNGIPPFNTISGEEFQKWLAEIKAVIVKLKSDSLTKNTLDLTNSFNGWSDETNFEKLTASLKAIYKNKDYYFIKEKSVMGNNYEIYNLLISGDENAWESNSVIFDLGRCIVEYTEKDIIDKFVKLGRDEINEIKKAPCIFAYEDNCKKDASIGYIMDIAVRQVGVKITFEKVEVLSSENLHKLQFELDIKDRELNRTHWAIKRVNLYKELQSLGINLKAIKRNRPLDITKHFFDVSFTFAGETRVVVEQVVKELEKFIEKNNIFYDNNYISQLARPSLDTLLQDIYRNRSKLIVVFLCEKYQEKIWCGLEFRAIREMIMEKEITKIMYIRLDAGHVDGVLKTDGYIDGTKFTPHQLANFINERLNLLANNEWEAGGKYHEV